MGYPFAVQLYSVRDEVSKDLWGALREVKKMGYDAVEFYGGFTRTAQEIRAALEDTGLACAGWHCQETLLEPDRIISTVTYNRVVGSHNLVIPWLAPERFKPEADCLKIAAELEQIAEKLAEYGMYLSFHNHTEEFVSGTHTPWYTLYGNTKRLNMQLDIGNARHVGPETDIYAPLSRLPFRSRTIHLKPYSQEKGYDAIIGEDDINWPLLFDQCNARQKMEWYIVEIEESSLYSPMECIARSLCALRKMERDGLI